MARYRLSQLPDHVLLRKTRELVVQERDTTARLLAHLAEIDARRLYAAAGYPSLYAWCVAELRFSEDAAYKRIQAARAARQVPELLERIAGGELHLSGVGLLAPHLTQENAGELLAAAAHKTSTEIKLLLAERFPQPDVPALLAPIAAAPACAQLASAQVGMTVPGQDPAPGAIQEAQAAPPHVDCAATHVAAWPASPAVHPRVTPLAPGRYALQVTLPQETHDKLRRVQELLGHAVPGGDLAAVLDRALELALRHLEHQRFAATDSPRRRRSAGDARYIPAQIKREVWTRDKGQCTYTGSNGKRCEAKTRLEYDHVTPVARGGRTCAANLRLRCRAHNQFAAEQVYGKRFMDTKRQAARIRASEVRKRQPADTARSPA